MCGSVRAGHPPVEVLELCGSGTHVVFVDELQQFDEARAFLRDRIPEAIQFLGKDHDLAFKMQRMYAKCLYKNDGASLEAITAAVATLEDLDRRQTRIYGAAHPQTGSTRRRLAEAREKLAERK